MEPDNYKNNGRLWTGLFLVAAGILLFAFKMGAPLPAWLFNWRVGLIAFGLLICIKHNFKNAGGLILVVIGSLSLADKLNPGLNLSTFTVPVIIIILGLLFIFRPIKSCKHGRKWKEGDMENNEQSLTFGENVAKNDDADYINSISVFGGVKKNILSKNFRGGEITCFMGGAEFNLSQSDIHSTVVLEVTQVFGGTKLIVPANWHIKTEVISVFGGIEDKRPVLAGNVNHEKVLVLVGTTVFGGIDIRSY